jgi:hypothetical protein
MNKEVILGALMLAVSATTQAEQGKKIPGDNPELPPVELISGQQQEICDYVYRVFEKNKPDAERLCPPTDEIDDIIKNLRRKGVISDGTTPVPNPE